MALGDNQRHLAWQAGCGTYSMGLPLVVFAMQSGAFLAESASIEVRGHAFANALFGT